jgi:hypothetical protein
MSGRPHFYCQTVDIFCAGEARVILKRDFAGAEIIVACRWLNAAV